MSEPGDDDALTPSGGTIDGTASAAMGAGIAGAVSAEADADAPTWAEDELLVMVASQAVLEAIAADHGVAVASSVKRSGYGVLDTAASATSPAGLSSLRGDARLLWSGPHGLMRGAGKGGKSGGGGGGGGGEDTSSPDDGGADPGNGGGNGGNPWDALYRYLQWHIADAGVPQDLPDVSGVTIAVLDTGVAYRDFSGKGKNGVRGIAMPSLASSAIVAPYDFVNDDDYPDDDHFHGTHIATTIAGDGDVMGVAPGAAIMPLKVLDADNCGYEIDLVEAIHHAVDNGADVINMSLAFGSGYVPSPAMSAALDRAVDAGVVLVGAAGNDGLDRVSFPAASPAVLAVTSVCPDGSGGHDIAPYSNVGVAADLAAPGGCLDRDNTGDLYPDGILAETIAPGDPSRAEMWMFAGTSQAAAVVSGAVAQALALGADPTTLALRIRSSTKADLGTGSVPAGYGTGSLDVDKVNRKIELDGGAGYLRRSFGVGIVPWLEDAGDSIRPRARLTVADETGALGSGVTVYTSLTREGTTVLSCVTGSDGHCDVSGDAVSRLDAEGAPAALAWGFSVQAVGVDAKVYRPQPLIFATDALEGVLSALQSEADIDYPVLAFEWEAGTSELGELEDAWSIVDSGAGISTSPFGLVLTRPAVDLLGTSTSGTLSGSGISSSPFGFNLWTLSGLSLASGAGISSSPFGLQPITIVSFTGSGISSSPFGMRMVYEDGGSGGDLFSGEPVLMGSSLFTGGAALIAEGTELGALVGSGGFVSLDGYAGASVLSESGSVPMTAGTASGGVQGFGAVRVP